MRLFFWTTDEFSCPELTRKWADKIWHFLGSALLVVTLHLWFGWSWYVCGVVVWDLGALWEVVVDCWILNIGASGYDLIADLLGMVLGVGIILLGAII